MRLGLFSMATIIFAFCLIVINTSSIPPEKIDVLFEELDYNVFSGPDINFSNDANLSNFIKYSGSGLVREFHGTYYFAAWVNTLLPEWIVENKDYFVYGVVLIMLAPLIAVVLNYVVLLFLALCLVVWEKMKSKRGEIKNG